MAELTEDQKMFIVRRRAHCVDIPDIITQFKEVYKLPLQAHQISGYDATTVHGRERMGKDLQSLFWKERKAYLGNDDVAIASLGMRLREYEKMLFAPTASGLPKSDKAKLEILAQVAKEVGGLFKARVSEQEALDYVLAMAQKARDAVDKHVTNPDERNRVHAAIQKDVEGQGQNSPS